MKTFKDMFFKDFENTSKKKDDSVERILTETRRTILQCEITDKIYEDVLAKHGAIIQVNEPVPSLEQALFNYLAASVMLQLSPKPHLTLVKN